MSVEQLSAFFRDCCIPEPDLQNYVSEFVKNDVLMTDLCNLTDSDLDAMKVTKRGHRIRILENAKKTEKEKKTTAVAESSKDGEGERTSPPRKKIRIDTEDKRDDNLSSFGLSIPRTVALHKEFFDAMKDEFPEAAKEKEVKGALWASTYLMPFLALLEKDYVDIVDGVSLLVVRNRIDYLELLFMVGDLSTKEILPALNLNETEVQRVTVEVMKKLSVRTNISLDEVTRIVAQEILQKTSQASATQARSMPMSQTISKKASVHYFRWKHAFKFGTHKGISEIKQFLLDKGVNEEDFFIEIANIFTITSTLGVHLRLLPNFGIETVKRSLKVYSINQPTTVSVVESLFCTLPPI